MASRGQISTDTLREWEAATPPGKLPEHVKDAARHGSVAALRSFGLRLAGEELRLKIPDRTFHGFDAATKAEAQRGHAKSANQYGDRRSSEGLAEMLKMLDEPDRPGSSVASRDPLDRTTSWSPPSSTAAGDAGSRMGLGPSSYGGI